MRSLKQLLLIIIIKKSLTYTHTHICKRFNTHIRKRGQILRAIIHIALVMAIRERTFMNIYYDHQRC